MLKTIIHKIALTCQNATLLMEKNDANKIGALEKKRLRLHLLICKSCRIYNQNIKVLNELFSNKKKNYDLITKEKIESIEKLKQKIKQNIPN